MIGGRLLEIDSVRRRLTLDFVDDNRSPEVEPPVALRRIAEEDSKKHETDAIAQVMVSVDVALLQVRRDVAAVQEQRSQYPAAESPRGARRGVREEVERPQPADRAQRDVHRTRPVDAERPRVAIDPVVDFRDEFARVPIVAGQPVRLSERREVLTAAQLPRNFDVGRPIELRVLHLARILERPFASGFEVGVPRQPRAERYGARAEQVEFVTQHGVRRPHDADACVRTTPLESGRPLAAHRR